MEDSSCMPVNRSRRGELGDQVVLEIRREGEELSQLKDERWELIRWALWGYIRDVSNVYARYSDRNERMFPSLVGVRMAGADQLGRPQS
jgi:hypothetical protein